ncbi:hypothetical protein DFJ77DRAFT_444412 [Powellomyces hirtus]|nr:hypothetical protein DFJ77DRAFT_444412 [Powellomyces hirtus]
MASAVATAHTSQHGSSWAGGKAYKKGVHYPISHAAMLAMDVPAGPKKLIVSPSIRFRLPCLAESHRLRTALQDARKRNPDLPTVRLVVANFSHCQYAKRVASPEPVVVKPPEPSAVSPEPHKTSKYSRDSINARKRAELARQRAKKAQAQGSDGHLKTSGRGKSTTNPLQTLKPPLVVPAESGRPSASRLSRGRQTPSGGQVERGRSSVRSLSIQRKHSAAPSEKRDKSQEMIPLIRFNPYMGSTHSDIMSPLPPVLSRRPSFMARSASRSGEGAAGRVVRTLDTPARKLQRAACKRLAGALAENRLHVPLDIIERAFLWPEEIYRPPPDIPSWMHSNKKVGKEEDDDDDLNEDSSSSGSDTSDDLDEIRARPPRRRSLYVKPAVQLNPSGSDVDLTQPQSGKINSWWTTAELKIIRARMRRMKVLRQMGAILEKSRDDPVALAHDAAAAAKESTQILSRRASRVSRKGFGSAKTGRAPIPKPKPLVLHQLQLHQPLPQPPALKPRTPIQKILPRRPWTEQSNSQSASIPASRAVTPNKTPRVWTPEGTASTRRHFSRPQSADAYQRRTPITPITIEPFFLLGDRFSERPRSATRSVFSDTGSDVIPRPIPLSSKPAQSRPVWEVTMPTR